MSVKNYSVPRTAVITNPETGKQITITHEVVRTTRPTDAYIGVVKFKMVEGQRIMDASDLEDLTPDVVDFPKGMEAIVMACDLNQPMLPVMFNHDAGNYRGVWILSKDLERVAGNF